MPSLSKSQYVKGRKCLKRLWLHNHQPEIASPLSAFQDGILTQGRQVGELARQLFPEGILISASHTEPERAIAETQTAIGSGKTVLFESAFLFDDILIRADILKKNAEGKWDLLEVKSSTNRTHPKKEFLFDLAIQKYVLEGAGLSVGSVQLVTLNRHYQLSQSLDLHKLFEATSQDEEVAHYIAEIQDQVQRMRQVLTASEAPEAALGSVCKSPFPCEYKSHCWQAIPEDSIHYLCHLRDALRHQLWDQGFRRLDEIPETLLTDPRQLRHLEALRSGEAPPQKDKVAEYLSYLKYPLYFLDFETYGYAVPRYEGTRPYQRLPFQYSLHVQRAPGAEYEHYEFLCDTDSDPRSRVAQGLLQNIGEEGSLIAYYAPFEKGVIEDLARDFPQWSEALLQRADRLWDLEIPFGARWICKREFLGRSSIKTVLPGMIPGFDYSDLLVQAGDQAMEVYGELIDPGTSPQRKAELKEGLLRYCERDTWAMVRILEEVKAHYLPETPSQI